MCVVVLLPLSALGDTRERVGECGAASKGFGQVRKLACCIDALQFFSVALHARKYGSLRWTTSR